MNRWSTLQANMSYTTARYYLVSVYSQDRRQQFDTLEMPRSDRDKVRADVVDRFINQSKIRDIFTDVNWPDFNKWQPCFVFIPLHKLQSWTCTASLFSRDRASLLAMRSLYGSATYLANFRICRPTVTVFLIFYHWFCCRLGWYEPWTPINRNDSNRFFCTKWKLVSPTEWWYFYNFISKLSSQHALSVVLL